MKKTVFSAAIFSTVVGLFLASQAVAAVATPGFIVSPTGSLLVTSIGEPVSFQVNLDPAGATTKFDGFDLDFWFDDTELSYTNVAVSIPGFSGNFPGNKFDFIIDKNTIKLAAFNFGGFADVAGAVQIPLATFNFTVSDVPTFDGMSDFKILDQDGILTGFTNPDDPFADLQTFTVAQGADVSPVPIPGAVWLFGSAIAGLIGMRSRKEQ